MIFVLMAMVQLMEDGGSGVSSLGAMGLVEVAMGLQPELELVTTHRQDLVAEIVLDRGYKEESARIIFVALIQHAIVEKYGHILAIELQVEKW